jgi:hypothetical protein
LSGSIFGAQKPQPGGGFGCLNISLVDEFGGSWRIMAHIRVYYSFGAIAARCWAPLLEPDWQFSFGPLEPKKGPAFGWPLSLGAGSLEKAI